MTDVLDITEQLQSMINETTDVRVIVTGMKAAEEIKRLQTEVENLRAALKRWEDTGLQKDWPITYDAALKETGDE